MNRRIGFALFSAFTTAGLVFLTYSQLHGQARRLITKPIDENHLVRLVGNTRPEANAENDRGAVADGMRMDHLWLQLKRPAEKEKALDQLIQQQSDKNSPNYHKWLTAAQVGEQFGPAKEDIATVTSWLESHGFTIDSVYPHGFVIEFSGTAGQIRRAFHAEIHNLEVNGESHFGNMSDPQIPEALAPVVAGVVSMTNFMPHPMLRKHTEYSIGGGYQLMVPGDLATIYNFNPLYAAGISGQGQTIVVIEDTDVYATGDWSLFRKTFGLARAYPYGTLTQLHPAQGTGSVDGVAAAACTDPGNVVPNASEAAIDTEWATAAAPNAAIVLASCKDTTNFGGFIALQNLLTNGVGIGGGALPGVVSVSYGESEASNSAASNLYVNDLYQLAAASGVTVFAATGDEGAASSDANATYATHGITVSAFASTPYDMAVGGTDFSDSYAGTSSTYWSSTNGPNDNNALSYVPEIPWNDSCASVLIAGYKGYSATYGTTGFCNSSTGEASYLTTASGSGGPSNCATGAAGTTGVANGTCKGYAKPSWQSLVGVPSDGVRDLPDVSLFAANGVWGHYYLVCWSDPATTAVSDGSAPCTGVPNPNATTKSWSGFGGTSFAAPIMAGIQALVNEHQGGKSQGLVNPTYYSLANTEYGASGSTTCNSSNGNAIGSSCIFNDVTLGDMDVPCRALSGRGGGTFNCYLPSGTNGVLSTSNSSYSKAYGTAVGWDFATGIGTVNAYNLVMNWP